MNDFKIRKVLTYPSSNFVPNTMYMKKSSADKFELKMAASDGSSLYRLWTPADVIVDSGTTLSGATAAKYLTQTTVNINTSGTLGASITSYDITVNNGPVINTTDLAFTFTMSDTPGDMMVIVVKPKDDIGTVYRLASYSVLTTNGVPLDSGLVIDGVTQLPEHESTVLTLKNYSSDITGFDYTVGLSSTQYIDVSGNATTEITVSPIGEVGQSIPIKVTPVDATPDEYLSVIHNIILMDELPVTTPIDVTLASSTPINETTPLQVSTTNPDITSFQIEVGTTPSTIYTIAGTAGSVDLDFALANVGDDVPVKITPVDNAGTNYVPYTTTMHIDAAAITNSGVTITGDATVPSRDSYTITMNNSNGDITQYAIKWNGVSQGTTPAGSTDWTKIMVLETGGTTLDLVVTPLSNTDRVYASITKSIDVTARAAVFSGMQVTGPVEIPINETLVLPFDNIPSDIASFDVTWDGAALTPLGGIETEFSRIVTEAVGTTISVVITPKSTDTDVVWFPITHNVTVTAAEAIDSGMTVLNDLTIEIGDTETFYFDKPTTVTEIKVYRDGTYVTTTTANSYTTPVENGPAGNIITYTFEPLSSGTLVFNSIDAKYEVVSTVAIDSGYAWTIPALTPRWNTETWIRSGATNPDVNSWEISVNGVVGATQASDYSSRSTGELSDPVGTRITATFTPISASGTLYKSIQATTVVGEPEVLPASWLTVNPDVTLDNYKSSFTWNITALPGRPQIAGYNLIGDDIDDIIGGTAVSPTTPLLGRTRADETASILLQAYTANGQRYEPVVRKITVDDWTWEPLSFTVDGVSALATDTSLVRIRDQSIMEFSMPAPPTGYDGSKMYLTIRAYCPMAFSGYGSWSLPLVKTVKDYKAIYVLKGTFREILGWAFHEGSLQHDDFLSAIGSITLEFQAAEASLIGGGHADDFAWSCELRHVNWLDFNLRQASSMPDTTAFDFTREDTGVVRADFANWGGMMRSGDIVDDLNDYSDRWVAGYGTSGRIDYAEYGHMMIIGALDSINEHSTDPNIDPPYVVGFFGVFKFNTEEKRWYGVHKHRTGLKIQPEVDETYPEAALNMFSYNNLLVNVHDIGSVDVWDYTNISSMLNQETYNQEQAYGILAYNATVEKPDLLRVNDFNKFKFSTFIDQFGRAVLTGPGPSLNVYSIGTSSLTKLTNNIENPRTGEYSGLKQHRRSCRMTSWPPSWMEGDDTFVLTEQLLNGRAWVRYQRFDPFNGGSWMDRLICDPGDAAAVYGAYLYNRMVVVPYRPNGGTLKVATFDVTNPTANLTMFDITGEISCIPVTQQIDAKADLLAITSDTSGWILNAVAENGLLIIFGATANTGELPIIQYGFNPNTRLYELLPQSRDLKPLFSGNCMALDIYKDRTLGATMSVLPNTEYEGYGLVITHPLRIAPWGRSGMTLDTQLGAWYFLD